MVSPQLIFWGTTTLFPKAVLPFYIYTSNTEVFQWIPILTSTYYFPYFWHSHSNGCEVISYYSFDSHFPKDKWYRKPLIIRHLYVYFEEMLFKSFAHFLKWVVWFFWFCIRWVLYTSWALISYQKYYLQFLPFYGLPFPCLQYSLMYKSLILGPNLSNFSFLPVLWHHIQEQMNFKLRLFSYNESFLIIIILIYA